MNIDNQGAARSASSAWWLRLLPLLAATIAVGTDAWVVAGFLPRLAVEMQVTTSAAGWSVTCFALAYALAAPVLAALTSGTRPRRVIAVALIILALANGVCAAANGFVIFLAGRVLAACAASVITPAAGVLAARAAGPARRGRALALVIAGLTIATAVGVPVGAVLADVTSWRTALGGVAVLAAVAAALIRCTAPNPGPGNRQTIRERLAPLTRPRVVSVLMLTVVGMTAAYIPYAYTSQLLPHANAETGTAWLVCTLTCYGIGAVVGSLASGALADRLGSTRTLTIAYALMVGSFATLASHPAAVVTAGLAGCWGAASWMQTPPQQHRLLTAEPEHGPVTIGSNSSALYAGIALGNTLGGFLLPIGTTTMCLTAAFVAVVALVWNHYLR